MARILSIESDDLPEDPPYEDPPCGDPEGLESTASVSVDPGMLGSLTDRTDEKGSLSQEALGFYQKSLGRSYITLPWKLSRRLEKASAASAAAHGALAALSDGVETPGPVREAYLRSVASGRNPEAQEEIRLAWFQAASEAAASSRRELSAALQAVEQWYLEGPIPRV